MSDEKPREVRLPDAIAHSVVPPAPETSAPSPPEQPEPAPPPEPPSPRRESPPPNNPLAIEEGPLTERMEELFPLAWLAMLTVVCVVGIYNAVTGLPNF